MAAFAGDAVGDVKLSRLLGGGYVKGVAYEASLGFFGGTDLKGLCNLFAERLGESGIGVGVFVACDPCGVFVLQDAGDRAGFDAAVAGDGRAGAGSDIATIPGVNVGRVGQGVNPSAEGSLGRKGQCTGKSRQGEQGWRRQKTAQIKSHGELPYSGTGM